jgi:hypothetical protein
VGKIKKTAVSANGTGLMHESFFYDDYHRFTRTHFAWANTLFGELVLDLSRRKPHLLFGEEVAFDWLEALEEDDEMLVLEDDVAMRSTQPRT